MGLSGRGWDSQPVAATAESPVGGAIHPSVLSPSPAEHRKPGVTQTLPGPGTLSRSQARPLVVSALQPGHRTQGLGRRPRGEGQGGRGVQGGGAEAGRGQQAVPLQEACEQ